jgi:arylsulfatase A-like enzyme
MLRFCLLFGVFNSSIAEKPNIIIILADDLGFNDMPWNNNEIIGSDLKKI